MVGIYLKCENILKIILKKLFVIVGLFFVGQLGANVTQFFV